MAKTLIGTATTDANGVATITYEATGAGDVTIVAESGRLSSGPYNIRDAIYYNPTPFTTSTSLNIPNLPSNFRASFICNTSESAYIEFGANVRNIIACGVTGYGTEMGMYILQNFSEIASDYQNVLSANTDIELTYTVIDEVHTLSDGTHTISLRDPHITERNYFSVRIDTGYLKELLITPL